jgi:hypothetical protein
MTGGKRMVYKLESKGYRTLVRVANPGRIHHVVRSIYGERRYTVTPIGRLSPRGIRAWVLKQWRKEIKRWGWHG